MIPLVVVLVVGSLAYLSFQAISTRGQIVQDLLFGALRIMGMYASVLSYVIAAFAPAEEGSLGMTTRAIHVDDWYEACGRATDAHRSAVLGAPEDFRNATGGAWVSDAPLYPDRPRPDSSGLAFADSVKSVVGPFSGAFSFASTELVACLSGHDNYRDIVISQLALLLGLSLVMLLFLLIMRCRPSLKEISARAASARAGRASQRQVAGDGGGDDGSRGGVTANPMFKKSGPQHSSVADLAVTSDKDGLPALSCGQTALWSVTRLIASIYVFVWASTLSASLQMIAPGVRVGDSSYITASSLALDAMQNTPLVVIAAVSLIVFGGLLPVYLLVFLTGNASRVLDVHRHESVTVAVLTTGYRLQLTSAETDRLVRQQLAIKQRASAHASAAGKTPISSKDSQQEMVLSMAREVSRRMEARCCGLAKYVPSHGFALVRQIQTVLVLCALWLLLDEIARACVIVLALVIAMALTYVLQPYALPELNSLDMQASLAIMVHVIVLVAGGWPLLGIGVWAVHGITTIAITVAVGRGLSQKARAAAKSVNSWIKNALPDLKDVDAMDDAGAAGAQQLSAQDKEVLQSASISLVNVARAAFSQIGFASCKRSPEEIDKDRRRHVLSGGPNRWRTFTERANRTIDKLVQDAAAGTEPSATNDAIERFLQNATGVQPSFADIITKPGGAAAAAISSGNESHEAGAGATTVDSMAFATAHLGAALARVRAACEAERAAAEAARAAALTSPRKPREGTKVLKPRRASVGGGPLSPSAAAAAAAAARPAGVGMRRTFNKTGVPPGFGAGGAAAALPHSMAAAGAKAARRSSVVGSIGVGMFGAGDSGSDDELHPAASAAGEEGARGVGRRRTSAAAGRRASLFVPAQGAAAARERLGQAEDAFAPVLAPDRRSRRMTIASQQAVSGPCGEGGRRSSVEGSRKSLAAAAAAAVRVTTPNPLARPGAGSE